MLIRSIISTSLAALALAVTSAPAAAQQAPAQTQAQSARPDWVGRFDDQLMRMLMQDLRASWTVEQSAEGLTTYRASAEGGINFVAVPRSCEDQNGCVGLVVIALFNDVNVNNAARLDAFINAFNDRQPTAKVMRDPQGMVALQAYINAANGITYRNLLAQMVVFGQNITTLSRALIELENG